MKRQRKLVLASFAISILSFSLNSCVEYDYTVEQKAEMKITLGREIFNDKNLSTPTGQSCSSCHSPATGFSDPAHKNVSPGAVSGLSGNRNAPIAGYTMFNPPFGYDSLNGSFYAGGLFVDGRVNTLEEQAKKPFLNPLEMNNPDMGSVVNKVKTAGYYHLYKTVYGVISDTSTAYDNIAEAIAEFERTPELNSFTSKFDYYLKGQASFTAQELNGLTLFKAVLCSRCHLTTPDPASGKILFTNFRYFNIGVPRNPDNPFYSIPANFNAWGSNFIDYGLGKILNDHNHDGEFRVPSLRNIAVSAPYFHNGVFSTLEEVVHFYNMRDVPGSGFAPPEVSVNVRAAEIGILHLMAQYEADIVSFLKSPIVSA